jgi:hypothetical protein
VIPWIDHVVGHATVGPRSAIVFALDREWHLVSVQLHHAINDEERLESGVALVAEVPVADSVYAGLGVYDTDPEGVPKEHIIRGVAEWMAKLV